MTTKRKTKIICTIGPASDSEEILKKLVDNGMDFARINLSHASSDYVRRVIQKIKKLGDIPIILDTQGLEVRTDFLGDAFIKLEEDDCVKIHRRQVIGDSQNLSLVPLEILDFLEAGDLIFIIGSDSVILKVSKANNSFVLCSVISGGVVGNRTIVITNKYLSKFPLTEKDRQILKAVGNFREDYLALSFVNTAGDLDRVRKVYGQNFKIIAKIENRNAFKNLDQIISCADLILVDRGDLGRDILAENVLLTQKLIIRKCQLANKDVFIATDFLESMARQSNPTRAEINDVINTILDGATGLVLTSETAVGEYPVESMVTLINLCEKAEKMKGSDKKISKKEKKKLDELTERLDFDTSTQLITPHGGQLINRQLTEFPSQKYLKSIKKLSVSLNLQMDIEQIAIGTFSPLEGFINEENFWGILEKMRLDNGLIWPIPIILDTDKETAKEFQVGDEIGLVNIAGEVMAILHLGQKYLYDKDRAVKFMYGTSDPRHPGVRKFLALKEVLLAGPIDFIKRSETPFKEYELTPVQVRRIFTEKGWRYVVSFHTRNIIHRSHEYIQMEALKKTNCDGLFIHPVIGEKKSGDFTTQAIIESYRVMKEKFYPKNKVVFGAFSTFSRYAGPREAIFTALCRQNFGCSHFIVGRDHTGVGPFYPPDASHKIFDEFPDLKIKPIKFNQIFYCSKCKGHRSLEDCPHGIEYHSQISGTEIRNMLEKDKKPPKWFTRPEIADAVLKLKDKGIDIFVR